MLRHRRDGYRVRHPGPTDALLVIEVADTSLAYDRDTKIPLYARAGIPEAASAASLGFPNAKGPD